jgi:hypothetical protein
MEEWLSALENSKEPAICFLYHVQILNEDENSKANRDLQGEIKACPRVQTMLLEWASLHPYQKWRGAHWVLALLADLGYPKCDDTLLPLREAEFAWLLDEDRIKQIPLIAGRYRRCASQEGNAVFAMVKLGLADERVDRLVELLLGWQWPDGGWNCDKKPEAHVSSFNESLIPLRGLAAYWKIHPDEEVKRAVDRASEFFLQRQLFRRLTNHQVIRTSFTKLCYPHYWHYDILFGLQVMSEAGKLDDPRCQEALDRVQARQLEAGGFPAEEKYYRVTPEVSTGASAVDWGTVSKIRANEFVSIQAWNLLKLAGRVE